MKSAFTMVELIFVIVILGILAALAVPKLAATRDDALLVTIKNDVSVLLNAIPANYQASKSVLINRATSLDLTRWIKSSNAQDEAYTFSINNQECITVAIWDLNTTDGATASVGDTAQLDIDINATDGRWLKTASYEPYLRIIKGSNDPSVGYIPSPVCDVLWSEMGLHEANISLNGVRVKF